MGMFGKALLAATMLALASCNAADGKRGDSAMLPGRGMAAFANDAEVDALLKKVGSKPQQNKFGLQEALLPTMAPPPAAAVSADAAETSPGADQITNVQERGVDEGGIVKRHGDQLVVLRRGRLFTIDIHGDRLNKIDQVDAFPPGKGEAWYDEMLISGDTVIVVGYSYGRFGTEVNRFGIDGAGKLTYRDTWHLRSADYYSDRNYASRLIGETLVMYQPIPMGMGEHWQDSLPGLRRWRGDDARSERNEGFERLAPATRIFAAAPLRKANGEGADVFHSVTTCNLAAADLDCHATVVLGSWSRNFYVSSKAVYVWTGDGSYYSDEKRSGPPHSYLYRMPLDGGKPQALTVRGNPIDQFSFFEDADKGVLNVFVVGESSGDAMWQPEFGRGRAALARLPLDQFGDGSQEAPASAYQPLPSADQGLQNRFVGRYLTYGGGWSEDGRGEGLESNSLTVVALDGGAVQTLALPNAISRLDVMGQDAVAIGTSDRDALGFSAIGLGAHAALLDSYFFPAASEGENRSQAFFYKPDTADSSGASGILALPVARRIDNSWARFLGSSSSIVFLNRINRHFAPAGELSANARGVTDDACIASCVDWYGNARPIFLGTRTFALMGYELVEGRLEGGRIAEVKRLDFAPAEKPAKQN